MADLQNQKAAPLDERNLTGYALAAVEELKDEGRWDADEERIACYAAFEPKDATASSPARLLLLLILRGEVPEGIYVYLKLKPLNSPKDARVNIDEVKKQITEYFRNKEYHYETPVAFGISEVREYFPRTFEDWTPMEEACYLALTSQDKSRAELARIFQRLPGAALTPPGNPASLFSLHENSAIGLLGAEVQCGDCYHSTTLGYRLLERVSTRLGIDITELDRNTLEGALEKFKCKRCGAASAKLQ